MHYLYARLCKWSNAIINLLQTVNIRQVFEMIKISTQNINLTVLHCSANLHSKLNQKLVDLNILMHFSAK